MVYAELQGKTSPEDLFTSSVFELFYLLPSRDLLGFLTKARTARGEMLEIPTGDETTIKITFWQYLAHPRVCVPDVILTVENPSSDPFFVIVENKTGSRQTGEQLCDYWQAGNIRYRDKFALVYLTHHRNMPKAELEKSEQDANDAAAQIFWLNWYALFSWVREQLSNVSSRPDCERKILQTLELYLRSPYKAFEHCELPRTNIPIPYQLAYMHLSELVEFKFQIYARGYFSPSIDVMPSPPYASQRSGDTRL
jgi:hypothetical protein